MFICSREWFIQLNNNESLRIGYRMQERMTAVRASVADIIRGTYNEEDGHHVVSPQGVGLRRVVLVGFIVRQYVGQGNFASITIDDGTETIRAKAGAKHNHLNKLKPTHLQ